MKKYSKGFKQTNVRIQAYEKIFERFIWLRGRYCIKITERIYVEPNDDNYPIDEAITRLTKVFGIASVSPVKS